jgi:hypothetical protein
MDDTTKEIAKATQEVAKTVREGLRATEKLGAFAARLVREPIESLVGILGDRLRYVRWTRQVRLVDKAEELIRERRLEGRLLPVPPKLALPVIENATLEEDDSLQDLWVRLLVAAADPSTSKSVRVAFVDVIRQLER